MIRVNTGIIESEQEDPLFDFELELNGDRKLVLRPGATFPEGARAYLSEYIQKTHKYKDVGKESGLVCYSLYQPPLNTPPGKRSLYYRLKRKYSRQRAPAVATVGVTKRCQCRCAHCSADYHMSDAEKELSVEELIRAVTEAVDLGVSNVIFLGGEPLMKRGFEDIVASIDKSRASVTMFTNGEYLTKEKCLLLKKAGLTGAFISIDSPDGERHNTLRKRENLFSMLSDGVANAREAGLLTAISTYLTSHNMKGGQFEKMMELGRSLGVNEVTFFDAIPVGRMGNNRHTYLTMEDRQKINQLSRYYRKHPDYPAVAAQSDLTSDCGSAFCFAANTQFYLSSTGNFCPCDFTPLTIGQFPQKSIAELWNDLTTCDLYKRRSKTCRMQLPEFREKTILQIPEGSELPYPIQNFSKENREVSVPSLPH